MHTHTSATTAATAHMPRRQWLAMASAAGWYWATTPLARAVRRGRQRPAVTQADRHIDWQRDDTAAVLRKVNAADGFPGVADTLFGEPCHLFDAQREAGDWAGEPGALLARRETALLRKTVDGAVWIGHVRRGGEHPSPEGKQRRA